MDKAPSGAVFKYIRNPLNAIGTVSNVSICIRKILGIYAVGDYEALEIPVKANEGMLLIPHDLVDGLTQVHASSLDLDRYDGDAIA